MSEIFKAIEAALTDEWQSAKQIVDKIDCWAPVSIRTRLITFAANDGCERQLRPLPGDNQQAFYRRHQHADQT